MFKPTAQLQRALRRLPLTTKQAGKDFYKGTRVGAMGRHTKYGGYKIDYSRVRTYVVPDLTDFMLKPFVSAEVEPLRLNIANTTTQEQGAKYLAQWKEDMYVMRMEENSQSQEGGHFEDTFDTPSSDVART